MSDEVRESVAAPGIGDALRNGVCTVCGAPRTEVTGLSEENKQVSTLQCSVDAFHAQDPTPEQTADVLELAEGGATFCENGECSVIAYRIELRDGFPQQNCPGCGQFGRIKD